MNMAIAVPFDTLAYAKKLEARGVEIKQAEAHAEVLAEMLEASFPTKQDFNASMTSGSHEVATMRHEMNARFSELKAEISEVKSEVIKWVFGISFAQAALIISALKFFH